MIAKEEYGINKRSICNILPDLLNISDGIKVISGYYLEKADNELERLRTEHLDKTNAKIIMMDTIAKTGTVELTNKDIDDLVIRINDEFYCESEYPEIRETIREHMARTKEIKNRIDDIMAKVFSIASQYGATYPP
ncbi:MAG: hypothetical protein GPW18_02075 [Euryarchaeota archaeon]|nr:hypothetical protein [Euryarchaeota archaeon]